MSSPFDPSSEMTARETAALEYIRLHRATHRNNPSLAAIGNAIGRPGDKTAAARVMARLRSRGLVLK